VKEAVENHINGSLLYDVQATSSVISSTVCSVGILWKAVQYCQL
jgi:hypothetical protein